MAGWAAAPTTRRPSSTRWAPTPSSTASSPTTRAPGTSAAQEAVLYVNHALVNPPIDRAKPVEQVKDVYITIQKETDAGIYVSGAKVVATNSALTHYNFLGQNMGQEINDPEHGGDVHGAHEHARHQADLPAVLRAGRRRHRLAVGLSAHLPLRRERRHLRVRQRLHPLGERVHPSRRRAPQGSSIRARASSTASPSRAARGSP